MAEIHEIKLKVSVDKDTKELKILDGELSAVNKTEKQLAEELKNAGKATDDTNAKMVNFKTTMKVLFGTFGIGFIANFFKSAALEAAKYDKESTAALNNSARVWRNLTETIGQGFAPVIKGIPFLINNIALGFARLRQAVEILMGGIASLINKNIKYKDEVKEANERYQQFVKDVIQGEMHLSKEAEKIKEDFVDKTKQLTLNKYEYERQKLQDELTAAKAAGVSHVTVAKYQAAKLKDITTREAEDLTTIKTQNDKAYYDLKIALADEGLQKQLETINKEEIEHLTTNAKLMAADKKYVSQQTQIVDKAEKDKQKVIFESISKKLDLNKLAGSTIDLLVTTSADKQKEMVWNIVKEEASGYAKRMLMAAALAVAQGNYAQAAIAAAQVAVAVGVARYADGEAEKIRIEAENNRIREEERIKLQEQKLDLEKSGAEEAEQIQENQMRYDYENGKVSTDVYIEFLKKKQKAYKAYTDSWMTIQSEIDAAEKERTQTIAEQAAEATALKGDITGSSVSTKQSTINNYITITLPVQVLDVSSVSESTLRDFATKLWGYLNQQLTGRG